MPQPITHAAAHLRTAARKGRFHPADGFFCLSDSSATMGSNARRNSSSPHHLPVPFSAAYARGSAGYRRCSLFCRESLRSPPLCIPHNNGDITGAGIFPAAAAGRPADHLQEARRDPGPPPAHTARRSCCKRSCAVRSLQALIVTRISHAFSCASLSKAAVCSAYFKKPSGRCPRCRPRFFKCRIQIRLTVSVIPLDRTVHLALTAHSIPLLPFICRVPDDPVRRFYICRRGCRRPRRHQRRQSSRCAGRARYHFPPQRRWQYRSTEPMREQIDQLQAFSCDFPPFAVLSKAFYW